MIAIIAIGSLAALGIGVGFIAVARAVARAVGGLRARLDVLEARPGQETDAPRRYIDGSRVS